MDNWYNSIDDKWDIIKKWVSDIYPSLGVPMPPEPFEIPQSSIDNISPYALWHFVDEGIDVTDLPALKIRLQGYINNALVMLVQPSLGKSGRPITGEFNRVWVSSDGLVIIEVATNKIVNGWTSNDYAEKREMEALVKYMKKWRYAQ
jgi:hypothetical protein